MTFVARLARVVDAQPDAVAIACAGEPALTYRQLWQRASGVAAALLAAGVRPGESVLLHLHKSPEWVAGAIGCWLARAAFVPLDPALPEARRTTIVAETAARFSIGTRPCFGCQPIDPVVSSTVSLSGALTLDEHAYTIYTSGSTGEPKGVVVSHRGIVDLLDAQIHAFDLRAGDRCLWVLSPSFDASISDIGTALLAGATLHIEHPDRLRSPSGIAELLRARSITHVDLPPSLLPLLPDSPSLRTIIIGGEVCAPAAVRAWSTKVRLVNVYGPTEATVCSTLCVCGPTWDRPLLGQPLPGVLLQIEAGELWIGGPAVANGYLARPELTAARFVERDGIRWFRTGDRVRRIGAELEFLGRIDRQLKVAGVLVAPEEIEARLLEHSMIADAVVVLERRGARELLVAYCVATPGSKLAIRELRAHLATRLDQRLMPRRIFVVDAIPRGPNGKLDTTQLVGPRFERAVVSPSGDRFARLAGVVGHVLELDPAELQPRDDFFELGGDSFAVIELVALADQSGIALSVEDAHRVRTLGALAMLGVPAVGSAAPSSDATNSATTNPAVTGKSCVELAADVSRELGWCRIRPDLAAELADRVITERNYERNYERYPLPTPLPRDRGAPSCSEPGRAATGSEPAILLTGATGLLGRHVLAELGTALEKSGRRIICLVRAPDDRAAAGGRVACFAGDVSAPRFGLAEERWRGLAEQVDTIVHCAADLSLGKSYDELRASNVGGVANIVAFARSGRRKAIHHASTLSVFVGSDRVSRSTDLSDVLAETDTLETAGRLHGGYAQSKWAAEYLLREAAAGDRIRTCVYRFGLLVADARSDRERSPALVATRCDWLTSFVRGLAALGRYPETDQDADWRIDITPIEFASRVMAAGVMRGETGVLHVANRRSASLANLVGAIERAGTPLKPATADEWVVLRGSAEPVVALATCRIGDAYARARSCDLFQATGMTFSMTATERLAAAHGIALPPPAAELLDQYVPGMLR